MSREKIRKVRRGSFPDKGLSRRFYGCLMCALTFLCFFALPIKINHFILYIYKFFNYLLIYIGKIVGLVFKLFTYGQFNP